MAKPQIRSSVNRYRALVCESLEDRRLLACSAVGGQEVTHPPVVAALVDNAVASNTVASVVDRSGHLTIPTDSMTDSDELLFNAQADDGSATASSLSTRATHQIGAIDGQRAFRGTLNWFNSQQTLRFSLERDANVQIALSPVSQNASLYLVNELGRVIPVRHDRDWRSIPFSSHSRRGNIP